MARSINKVILIGNAGKDPEVRYTPNNTAVASFSLATTDSWKDQSGNNQEKTEWHNLVVWGRLAEICQEYVKKGHRLYIEGRLQTRSWEDKEGVKRNTTEVVVNEMMMLTPRGSSDDSFSGESKRSTADMVAGEPEFVSGGNHAEDDDLPF